ncbi:MAG: lysine-2,3-aminomutase-like protein [Alphaproteobacteria bacterium]|nr:lysine-2,3-aminomutase-like protein [Alphaproteobacteria bacterium]
MATASSSRTLRTSGDLVAAGLAAAGDLDVLERVGARYAIAVTPPLAALIDRADPADPIARQFTPSAAELDVRANELADPIGDHAHEPVEGLVHRYPDRVLLKVVAVCPVYCRFCFRREMVGPGREAGLGPAQLQRALDYIAAHPGIREVILTGGDPFMLSAARAAALTRALEAIDHVRTIRWHTRMPVADPERIDAAFVAALRSETRAVYVVLHANHPRELTAQARAACARMTDAGIGLLSQSVLLRGVNDDIDTLADLMRTLVEARVKPYYLHHPDLAPGTAHFRVPLATGQALVRELRDRVSGLGQPHYVVDIPGGVSKALASPPDVATDADGVRLRGRDGRWRDYAEE